MGRPKKETDLRDSRVVAYFTEEDAHALTEFAKSVGLTRSALISATFERLLEGGFSVMVFIKLALQIQKRADEVGNPYSGGLYFGVRPLPPLPDVELTKEEIKPALEQVKELQKQC